MLLFTVLEIRPGRGVFRNYYKGHMDKTKGESGGDSEARALQELL